MRRTLAGVELGGNAARSKVETPSGRDVREGHTLRERGADFERSHFVLIGLVVCGSALVVHLV